jgi:hypothetical protein
MKEEKFESLLTFMKNQINQKSYQENTAHNFSTNKKDKFGEQIEDEELRKQKIKKAKIESVYKASQYNKFEMYKQMIKEAIIGQCAIIIALTILFLAIIKIGPALISFFNILLYKFVMSSLVI